MKVLFRLLMILCVLPLGGMAQDDQDLAGLKALCVTYTNAVLTGDMRALERAFHPRMRETVDENRYLMPGRKVKMLELDIGDPVIRKGGTWLFATVDIKFQAQFPQYRKEIGDIVECQLDVLAVKEQGGRWQIGLIPFPNPPPTSPPTEAMMLKQYKERYPNIPDDLKFGIYRYAMVFMKLIKKDAPYEKVKMPVEDAIRLKYKGDPDTIEMMLAQVRDNSVRLAIGSGGSFGQAAAIVQEIKGEGKSTRKADTVIRGFVGHELKRIERRLTFEESKVAALASLIELRETKLSSKAASMLEPHLASDAFKQAEVIAKQRLKESFDEVKTRAETLSELGKSAE